MLSFHRVQIRKYTKEICHKFPIKEKKKIKGREKNNVNIIQENILEERK